MRCMSCERTEGSPWFRRRGAPGGHADRSLVGECGHRRSLAFEPLCVLWKPSFAHVELVSDRHVHDPRRRPNQSVPPRPADSAGDDTSAPVPTDLPLTHATPPARLTLRRGTSLVWVRRS
jgi:hypothetical protein